MTQAAENLTRTPADGLYRLGQLEYDTIDAVNISSLVDIAISPRFYRYRRQVQRPETDAMRLGTATDMAVFEPDRFARSYAVWTGFDDDGKKRVRRGEYWEKFQQLHHGKVILDQDEYDSALNMRRVIEADPLAMEYLEDGTAQDTLIWRDKYTGILCKGRTDWITSESCKRHPNALADLKTAKSVVPWKFASDGTRLFYHAKMAWYADAFEIVTFTKPSEVVLIAVENIGCHDVVVYDLDDEQVLDYGRAEYHKWLELLAECKASNKWPGIGKGAKVPFSLPKYARNDNDDESFLDDLDFGGET